MEIDVKNIIQNHFPMLYEPALMVEMAKYCTLKNIEANNNFIEIGQQITGMPLLYSGTLKVVREDQEGNEILLYYITGGETCATTLTCCIENNAHSEVRATVMEDVKAIFVPIKCMTSWLQKYASWRVFVLTSYRSRFEELLNTVDSIAFMKMDERIEKYLHQRKADLKSNVIVGTHQEIASDLHTSREVVSRLLKQLEKLKRIKLSRNKIEIL